MQCPYVTCGCLETFDYFLNLTRNISVRVPLGRYFNRQNTATANIIGVICGKVTQVRYGLRKRTPNYILYIGFLLYEKQIV